MFTRTRDASWRRLRDTAICTRSRIPSPVPVESVGLVEVKDCVNMLRTRVAARNVCASQVLAGALRMAIDNDNSTKKVGRPEPVHIARAIHYDYPARALGEERAGLVSQRH